MPTFNSRRAFFGVAAICLGLLLAAIELARMTPATASNGPITYREILSPRQAVVLTVPGDLGAGVRVSAWDKNSVELSAQPRGEYASRVTLTPARDPSTVRLGFGLGGPSTVRTMFHLHETQVDVVVHVPRRATVSVSIINGAVVIEGVTGPLTVDTVNGPIDVSGAGSVLSLHCTNGPVSAIISDLAAVPDVDISTVAGPVDVRVPAKFRAEIDAHTVFGPLDNALPSTPGHGRLRARSTAGPVSVGYN